MVDILSVLYFCVDFAFLFRILIKKLNLFFNVFFFLSV